MRVILVCISIFIMSSVSAQNYEPGTLQFKDGRNIEGFIKNDVIAKNTEGIFFKESIDLEPSYYGIKDLRGYIFSANNLKYIQDSIKIYDDYLKTYSDKVKFGQILIDGDVQLIRFHLKKEEYNKEIVGSKNYLYLIYNRGDKYQIDLYRSNKNNIGRKVTNAYQEVLKYVFRDCESIIKQSSSTSFTNSALIDLINKYAECKELSIRTIQNNKLESLLLTHHINIGPSIVNDKQSINQTSIYAGYEMNIYLNKGSESTSIQVSSGLNRISYDSDIFGMDFNQLLLETSILFSRKIIKTGKFSLYLNAGVSSMNAITSDSDLGDANNFFLLTAGSDLSYSKFKFSFKYMRQPSNSVLLSPEDFYAFRIGYQLFGDINK